MQDRKDNNDNNNNKNENTKNNNDKNRSAMNSTGAMMTSPPTTTTTTGINVERDTALFMASPTFAGDYLSIPENQQPQQPLPPPQQRQEQLLTKSEEEEEESDDERVVSDSSMIWKDFMAGNFAGIAGIIAGHPFDTVKTRIQTNPTKYSTNVFKCLADIVRKESVFGLYKGMASPVLGVGILNALIFGVYGNTMRFLDGWRGVSNGRYASDDDEDELDEEGRRRRTISEFYTDIFVAGALGGLVNCAVCSPLELVKTRLQIQDASNHQLYKGPIDCIGKTWKLEGIRGVFKGMYATILRDMPSYGVYFVGYEFFKGRWGESPFALLMAGGSAGVFCWILSYPFDVVKSRIQAQPVAPTPGHDLYKGVIDCTVKSCRREGYGVLFRGLNSAIVRAFPVNAVTFFTYEMILKILNAREGGDEEEDDSDESL